MNAAGTQSLEYIFEFHALALFVLGVVALLLPRGDRTLGFAPHLKWLGVFGLALGTTEFISAHTGSLPPALAWLGMGLLAIGFGALLEFGRRSWNAAALSPPLPAALLYALAVPPAILLVFAAERPDLGLETAMHYMAGLPGATLSAAAFLGFWRAGVRTHMIARLAPWLLVAGVAMLIFAALVPFHATRDTALPSWLPSAVGFRAATGMPVEFPIALCVVLLALSFIVLIREATQRTEESLRRVVDNLHGFVYRCRNDRDWTVVYMSEGAETLTGYPAADFLRQGGLGFGSLIHPDDQDAVWDKVQLGIDAHRGFEMAYRIVRQDGGVRWVYERGNGVFGARGELLFLEGHVGDDTARHQAEAELRIKDAAIETSVNPVAMADPDGRLVYVNRAFVDLWKLAGPEQALGRSALEFWETPGEAEAVIEALFRDGQWQGELTARRADAVRLELQLSAHMVRDTRGEPLRLMASFVDVTTRRAAEKEVQRERDFVTSLMSAAPVLVVLVDTGGRVEFVNSHVERLCGYRLDELKGRDWFNLLTPEVEREHARALFRTALGDAPSSGLVVPIITRSGEERRIEWHDRALHNPGGEVTAILAVGLDVTERQAALEREYMLQRLVDFSPQPIGWANLDGSVRYLNRAFRRAMGVPQDTDAAGYRVRQFYDERSFSRLEAHCMPEALSTGSWSGELIATGLNGRRMEALHSIFCLRDASEEPLALAVVLTDLTDLKRALAASAESESRYRMLYELSNDGIVYADVMSTRFVAANPRFAEMIGRKPGEVRALSVKDIHPPAALAWVKEQFNELAAGRITIAADIPVQRADGSVFHADVTATTIQLEGRPVMAGIFRDVTRRRREARRSRELNKQLEARVRERTRELEFARAAAESANRAKSEFLSRMSHELRTPLNAVLGFARLLESDADLPLADHQRGNVDEILRAGEQLLDLVDQVLELNQVENGQWCLKLVAVSLRPVIRHAIASVSGLARECDVRMCLGDCTDLAVVADPERLKEVLRHLLVNAVKFNHQGGQVDLDCIPVEGCRLRVRVRDSGRGIPGDELARLFRPFERVGSAYEGIGGAGIGLALCRRLVEAMGGKIGAESTPGAGSTFWFELLLYVSDEDTDERSRLSETGLRARPPWRVLYVADNPADIRLVTKALARRKDVDLLQARDGESGLRAALDSRPDLILMDLNLPDMDGSTLLTRLRGQEPTRHMSVIALIADTRSRDMEQALEAGFDAHLTKPLDIAMFLELIDDYLPIRPVPVQ